MTQTPLRPAPSFSLPDQDGKIRTLAGFLQNGPLVVVFYPGDFTPTCTKQLCSYRDAGDEFRDLGIQIVGMSNDSVEKHKKFATHYKFEFPLLSDADKSVAKAYGATSKWMFGAVTRANFIVDRQGKIVFEHIDATPLSHQKQDDLSDVIRKLREEKRI